MSSIRLQDHLRRSKRFRIVAYFVVIVLSLIIYEWRTSFIQSWVYSNYARKLQFTLGNGPSPSIVFPQEGPFDERRGYVNIPEFVINLKNNNYEITRQVRFSPSLAKAVSKGITPPYKEKNVAGLSILDGTGMPLYESIPRERIYAGFDDIPEDVIKILLFIENRELLKPTGGNQNPVFEWDRMAKAGIQYVGSKMGLPIAVEGGSTLATQLEKYQHSQGGRTAGAKDKILQITSASIKAYRSGRDTTVSRREIVTDYINTMPLASVEGYGEVNGLGEGLLAWFGTDIRDASAILRSKEQTDDNLKLRGTAFKEVMALFLAVKAPTDYLVKNRTALLQRIDHYADLMLQEGEISPQFHDVLRSLPLEFRKGKMHVTKAPFFESKAPNAIRYHLLKVLDLPGFYDLDRLDLIVNSTLNADMQKKVTKMLGQLADQEYVTSSGLSQERMLKHGDLKNMIYSFLLYEKTPSGNVLRVQADNLDKPLDINAGVKLDLGSTAKLRTLAHYLQIISESYEEMSGKDPEILRNDLSLARDPISRWIVEELSAKPGLTLSQLLEASMERRYSGNPAEVFFTGGGEHRFENFNKADNSRTMTVSEGLKNSVNLVFVRLMRDIVSYHTARLGIDTSAVMKDRNNEKRKELLVLAADKESRNFLSGFVEKYKNLPLDRAIEKLLGTKNVSPRHLAILFYSMRPSASPDELAVWLRERSPKVQGLTDNIVLKLAGEYGRPALDLSDYGYLLNRHPLELWTIGFLESHPQAKWQELVQASSGAREESSVWLFSSRNKRAQDIRLRILIEEMAFAEIHKGWERLGYPFGSLVPSYATSIGSSADRPSALAELMGIIVNDGLSIPALKVISLNFAKDTPYETELLLRPVEGERVMPEEVAGILKKALAGVVEGGTARGVAGAFKGPDGRPLPVGGKTGSGDNRFETFGKGGELLSSRVVNRTATFVFFIGDRHYGVITAFMPGQGAADYSFTSSLPVNILRLLAPELKPMILSDL